MTAPRTHGECPKCHHYGSDCKCHLEPAPPSVKHTPGPWQVSGVRFKWRASHSDQVLDGHSVGPDSDPVCVVFYGNAGQHSEQIANARLIAAAPDLLTALRDLCDAIPDETVADDPPLGCWIKRAREVIAQAEGRTP